MVFDSILWQCLFHLLHLIDRLFDGLFLLHDFLLDLLNLFLELLQLIIVCWLFLGFEYFRFALLIVLLILELSPKPVEILLLELLKLL